MRHHWRRNVQDDFQQCIECGEKMYIPTPEKIYSTCPGKFASTDDKRVENNPPTNPIIPEDPMRTQYRVLTDDEKKIMGSMKSAFEMLWLALDDLGQSRDISRAKTHLEDACMRAVRHITGPKHDATTNPDAPWNKKGD